MVKPDFKWIPLTLILALLAACSSQEKQPAQQDKVQEVGVQIIQPQSLEIQQTLAGRTTAYLTSDVRPQVGGIINKRLFNEGDDVKAGQALYQLDASLYQAAFNSAKGDLAKAEAALVSAQPKAQHYRNLLKIEAVSKQDAADAESSLKEYQAAVTSAQAALDTAKINLQYTTIRAPISGRIATSTYTPGALVTAEQTTALTTIQQLNPIYVDITLSSAELLALRKQMDQGQLQAINKIPVNIILEDGSTYDQQGQLQFIGSTVATDTGNVKLRALVPNPKYLLLPGMYVKAQLPMAINHQAILIPQTVVTRNHKGEPVVKLVNSQNQVEEKIIQTSETKGNQWVVTSGLKAGDRLIIDGASTVSSGSRVKITAQKNTVTSDVTTNSVTKGQ
ncbi:efflux RND transporter periplasmic adaptor subunit [Acinetobacter qingfengensis]|uniref:Efflux transporter periplasmic adaptor subunit n=1 Tax=Acinetobacter qingfengensis TaxID=1262585 RepID=A0A1E7R9G8_9GAMM|nr:efflux RND transporter periplasmic adaptor subunit [Acinetobacter qingfengensis]KAA8735420.1 efflux RND transporter periplasmic adaptor subunit [Acinetobacter qingfengensis]OEY95932.1 efflux transporter periplasmic adaptor subunit [Acinetobacter qingfengensis]